MGNKLSDDRKLREQVHYDGEGVYVISFLERDSPHDRRVIRAVLRMWDRHLSFLRPEWIIGKTVIDVCCGNPRSARYLKKLGARIAAGSDISEGHILRGLSVDKSYALGESVDNESVSLFVSDAERLPVTDATFDTVCIFQALHHLDPEAFFTECARVLKPGGILFVSDPNGGHPLRSLGNWVGRHFGVMSSDEVSHAPSRLISLMAKSGLTEKETHHINLFSELFFLMTVLLEPRAPAFTSYLRLLIPALLAFDIALENTLFRLLPILSWRVVIIAENTGVKPQT